MKKQIRKPENEPTETNKVQVTLRISGRTEKMREMLATDMNLNKTAVVETAIAELMKLRGLSI